MTVASVNNTTLPHFEVELAPPDLSRWRIGNTGLPGFTSLAASAPGPHLGITALIHGNEIAGAIVLDRLLRDRFRPTRGRLTIGFINLVAFDRFEPDHPTVSRFVDEDMNRLWDEQVLGANRHSCELDRAREIRPLIERFDVLLDLHSMLWPSEPLLLCGSSEKGRTLAAGIGVPSWVVADAGHASGRRLIDFAPFTDPNRGGAAVLLESGQHWQPESVTMTEAAVAGVLRHLNMADLPAETPASTPRFAQVTRAITATTGNFSFVRAWRGGDVVHQADTLIAMDGAEEIRTPHDDCLLIMPSLRPSRGHTAVRLARSDTPGGPILPPSRP